MNIAVLRYRYIGDTLLCIPFLKALRAQHPEANVTLLTGADMAELMQCCPYVNQVEVFEPKQLGWWQSVQQLRAGRYDKAYVLKRSFSSALYTALAGIPQRIGFDTEKRGMLLTKRVPYRADTQHEAECFLDCLEVPVSLQPQDAQLNWLSPQVMAQVAEWIPQTNGPKILLHGTSSNMAKAWPLSHFQHVATQYIETQGATIFLLGTASDAAYYAPLYNALKRAYPQHIVNLCGQTSLLQSAAIVSHMDGVVANDSGMVHLASALDRPVTAVFGPMRPQQWRPLSPNSHVLADSALPCVPCKLNVTCGHTYPCTKAVTPQQVLNTCLQPTAC